MPCDPALLAGVGLFEHLDDEGRQQLAQAVKARQLSAGSVLFNAGEPGEALFIVKSGQIERYIKDTTGQKIALGDVVGALGSSGNSTEPHLHFQVCDSPEPLMCAGIPPTWRGLGFSFEDFPRAPQSGDMLYDLQTPKD